MRYHFIAIGGAAMHNLAIALAQAGHDVSGSDDEIFEPSRSRLEKHGLLPSAYGWFPERITSDIDAVILGMHARKDNPELVRAEDFAIPVYSFPEFLYRQYIDKKRVVVAGSHGKTTITAMILHVLKQAGQQPDYMVGAQLDGFDVMVRISAGDGIAVLEGDEYLTSPVDRRSKFLHYHPHLLLISGIAWDHMNVFPTFDDYLAPFVSLIHGLPENGAIVYNVDDPVLKEMVERETPEGVRRIPYSLPAYHMDEGRAWLEMEGASYGLQVFGRHNLSNLMGAAEVCRELGIGGDVIWPALASFPGASRRLERVFTGTNLHVFRDFAHAPSKLKATVGAVRELLPGHHLVACMELHTYSSLNADFLPHYAGSMQGADTAIVFYHPDTIALKKLPPVSAEQVRTAFDRPDLLIFHDSGQLQDYLMGLKTNKLGLLMMSSGDFHGIQMPAIIETLQQHYERNS